MSQLEVFRPEDFPSIHARVSLSFLLGPPTDWVSPATSKRAMCFISSTDSNVSFGQKHLHRDTQNNM